MFIKYDKICRICLEANGSYKLSELSEYGETFTKLTEISYSNDSFPDNICQRCKMYLKICHKFRVTAMESNEKLISFLNIANENIQSDNNFSTEAIKNLNFNDIKILLSEKDRVEIISLEKETLEAVDINNFQCSTNNNYMESDKKENEESETNEEYLDDYYIKEDDNSEYLIDDPDWNSENFDEDNSTKQKTTQKTSLRKFKEFWLDLFKPWLTKSNGKAYCKYCSAYLENILAHIKRHSNTTKHEKNTLIYNNLNKQEEKLSKTSDNIVVANKNSILPNATDENPVVKNKPTKMNIQHSSNQTKAQVRRFKEFWLDLYKPWLCEINGQAHCRYCCSKIENILRHIERHLSTTKHQRNAIIYLETGKEIPSEEKILEFLKDCKKNTCDYCDKSFSCKEQLHSHINRSHVDDDGVARFQCAQCNKKFSLIATVKNHLKNHPIHKPVFSCYNCKEKFARKGTLKHHMFQCIKNFESGNCSDCNVHFKDFDSYLYHFNEVHKGSDTDVIDENCWICGNNFNSENELREHLLEHDIIEL